MYGAAALVEPVSEPRPATGVWRAEFERMAAATALLTAAVVCACGFVQVFAPPLPVLAAAVHADSVAGQQDAPGELVARAALALDGRLHYGLPAANMYGEQSDFQV